MPWFYDLLTVQWFQRSKELLIPAPAPDNKTLSGFKSRWQTNFECLSWKITPVALKITATWKFQGGLSNKQMSRVCRPGTNISLPGNGGTFTPTNSCSEYFGTAWYRFNVEWQGLMMTHDDSWWLMTNFESLSQERQGKAGIKTSLKQLKDHRPCSVGTSPKPGFQATTRAKL